jgi:hypothetical protein
MDPVAKRTRYATFAAASSSTFVDSVWQDKAGNLVGLIGGSGNDGGSTDHDESAQPRGSWHTWMSCRVDDRQAGGARWHAARDAVGDDVSGQLRPRPGRRAWGPADADGSAVAGLGAHDEGESANLGNQARRGRQSLGLAARLRLHRPLRRGVDGRGGRPWHPRLRGPKQADAGGCRRLPRVLLPGRPRSGDRPPGGGAPAARPRAASRRRRLSRADHQRGDRRGRRLVCQPHSARRSHPRVGSGSYRSGSTPPPSAAGRSSRTAMRFASTTRRSRTA